MHILKSINLPFIFLKNVEHMSLYYSNYYLTKNINHLKFIIAEFNFKEMLTMQTLKGQGFSYHESE